MSAIPLASQDGWSYGSGDFYVEASGHNRHRRATLPELKSHFDTSSDRPAHWYEAQLLHYGLPPSKTKGTAKMRLFEAVNKGNLSVPAHITKLESSLKKEWTKLERESKQALKKGAVENTTPAKKGTKRKADDFPAVQQIAGTQFNLNLSFSTGPLGTFQVTPTASAPAPKKARTSTAKDSKPAAKATAPKAAPRAAAAPKPTAAKTTKAAPAKKPAAAVPTVSSEDSDPPKYKTKQTARRGNAFSNPGNRAGSSRSAAGNDLTSSPPRQPQTARRSKPLGLASRGGHASARGGASGFSGTSDGYNDPPPPYSEVPSSIPVHDEDDDSLLSPLGLLNGRYEVRVNSPPEARDYKIDSGIILTLDGNALWGKFEIGPLKGMFRLDHRPFQSSHQPLVMRYIYQDDDGYYGPQPSGSGELSFIGGGEIHGGLPFRRGILAFQGYRISGQATRSEISAWDMRASWSEMGGQI
ncbi:hypothetical protein QBC37DRAFT_145577 [Rhypophila decipiens]|uniref:Uncharacterized protein n=1 Tax=Rhypophila decipiens TaxID=261697 RepID=A0AAN7BB83_9PEZI|nr:hypothetical protein QBC37DRAFT_145577 [Rhypophila decipiens]